MAAAAVGRIIAAAAAVAAVDTLTVRYRLRRVPVPPPEAASGAATAPREALVLTRPLGSAATPGNDGALCPGGLYIRRTCDAEGRCAHTVARVLAKGGEFVANESFADTRVPEHAVVAVSDAGAALAQHSPLCDEDLDYAGAFTEEVVALVPPRRGLDSVFGHVGRRFDMRRVSAVPTDLHGAFGHAPCCDEDDA